MDISALSLALGAQTEQTGQTPVAPGFDLTLEQAAVGGFVPPGAPPGPPPPPDILVAGEGVEVLEPNAQPQKLDFLPQETADLDIELPEPFWEKPVEEKLPVTAKPVDEAMEWLAGQMVSGFFTTPIPPADSITSEFKPKSSSDGECIYRVSGDTAMPGCDVPVIDLGKVGWTQPKISSVSEPVTTPSETPAQPELMAVNSMLTTTPPAVDPVIVEALNVTSIKVEAEVPEKVEVPQTDGTVKVVEVSPETVEVSATATAVVSSEPAVEANDPLFTKQPLPEKPAVETLESPKTEAKPVEVASTPAGSKKPLEKPANESTTLEVTGEKPKANQSDNEHSNRGFGRSNKNDKPLNAAVIEVPAPGRQEKVQVSNPGHRESLIEVSAASRLAEPKKIDTESLSPKEVDLVVKQVVDKLHMLAAARPKNGVTIHLNPDDLGSITVVVKSIGRMVDTQITASDDRVRQALDQNQTRLVEAMDARGFQVQNVAVSTQTNHSTQQESTRNWQQPGEQRNQSQSGQSHGHRGQADRHFEQPKSNIRAWVRRGEGVDLSI